MDKSSSADLPDFARGAIAIIAHLPGVALLADDTGRVLFANDSYYKGLPRELGPGAPPPLDAIPEDIVQDALGSTSPSLHSLRLPSGRKAGVACIAVRSEDRSQSYVLVREDGRQAIVAKFVTAQESDLPPRTDQTDRLSEQARLKAEANHWRLLSMSDRLTGLFNATGFRDRVSAAMEGEKVGALVYADLNGFKMVNDTLGHAAGDEVLKDIGQALRTTIRSGDIAGRMGGDEFAIYLPGCPPDELEKVVERLRVAMSRRIPVSRKLGQTPVVLKITPAIGTASFPEEELALDDLLRRADARMYADKSAAKSPRRLA
ncbi:GGDEF domain-containing protein [Pseudooceanicola onchidii]|uniref:GGDEF domain-containing protein n=1 Tax=Pseudooceanicola onchidii TaxID=2562279 RepID=UPI00145BF29E|nr:GGDEF domain-containing protein [Pseudooceanicola onchidii]